MKSSAPVTGAAAIDRALGLLHAIVSDGGAMSLGAHADRLGLPISTAYRMVEILRRRGLITAARRGHYVAGMGLAALGEMADRRAILVQAARPLLRRLARETRATAHLGIFEGDMISYIVKERGGGADLFTREGGQLEAYCSAIGKVLLAELPAEHRDAYLAAGPFVPLTARTITDVVAIRDQLAAVRANGFALDDREIADNLFCIAAPVRDSRGNVLAALSLSMTYSAQVAKTPPPALLRCAEAVSARLR